MLFFEVKLNVSWLLPSASGSRRGGSEGTPDLTIERVGNRRVSRSHPAASPALSHLLILY